MGRIGEGEDYLKVVEDWLGGGLVGRMGGLVWGGGGFMGRISWGRSRISKGKGRICG